MISRNMFRLLKYTLPFLWVNILSLFFLMKRVNILSLITIVPNKWCSKFFKSIISSLVTHYSYMLVWVFENDTSTFVLNVGSEEYASSMFCKYFVRNLWSKVVFWRPSQCLKCHLFVITGSNRSWKIKQEKTRWRCCRCKSWNLHFLKQTRLFHHLIIKLKSWVLITRFTAEQEVCIFLIFESKCVRRFRVWDCVLMVWVEITFKMRQ